MILYCVVSGAREKLCRYRINDIKSGDVFSSIIIEVLAFLQERGIVKEVRWSSTGPNLMMNNGVVFEGDEEDLYYALLEGKLTSHYYPFGQTYIEYSFELIKN